MTTNNPSEFELPVKGTTPPKKLAGMIRSQYRNDEGMRIRLSAIGVSAVNQCVKAVVELNKILISTGCMVNIIPTMEDRTVPDRNDPSATVQRTVIIFNLSKISVVR